MATAGAPVDIIDTTGIPVDVRQIYVTQSTSLVQINTSEEPGIIRKHIVLLSSLTTLGSLVTIRDITGNASSDNPINISTTLGIDFYDGSNESKYLYKITQPFGFMTITPATPKVWRIINTYGFAEASSAAQINNLTASSILVNNSHLRYANISTALISTLSTDNVFIRANLSVGHSTIAHAGYYTCTIRALHDMITNGTLYAGSTVSSMFGNITSTLTVPYISTQNIEIYGVLRSASTISTMGNIFCGSSISTVGNLAVGGSTFIQGELKVLQNVYFQSSLSTLYSLGVGREVMFYSTLAVKDNIFTNSHLSTGSNLNVGGALSVMKTAFFTGNISTQSNLTVGGALSVMSTFYTYGDVLLNSSLNVRAEISTLSNVYIASTLSIGRDLIVYGSSYFTKIAINSNLSVGHDLFVNNNISTPSSIVAGQFLRIMGSTFLMGPVSTLSNMNVGGGVSTMKDLAVTGVGYFQSNVVVQSTLSTVGHMNVFGFVSTLSSMAIGHSLQVGRDLLVLSTLNVFGSTILQSSVFIKGSVSVFSSLAVAWDLNVVGKFTLSSLANLNGSTIISTLAVTNTVGFGLNISSSTLHHGLFSTFGAMDIGGKISTTNALIVGSTIDTQFITVRRNLSTIGDAYIGSNLFVLSSIQSGASTIVDGGFYTKGQARFVDSVRMNTLTVDNGATIGGLTTIDNNTNIKRTLTVTGGLRVSDEYQQLSQNRISNDTYMASIQTSSIITHTLITASSITTGELNITSATGAKSLSLTGPTQLNGNVGVGSANVISPGSVVTTYSGSGAAGFANGAGTAATYEDITSVASDSQGRIYVYTRKGNTTSSTREIRRIDNGTSSTLITPISCGPADFPAMHLDRSGGTLFYVKCTPLPPFAGPYNGTIISRRTTSDNGLTYGAEVNIITNGVNITAMFQSYNNSNKLYYVDQYGIYILEGIVSTLIAGNRDASGNINSTGTNARFGSIYSICLDSTETYMYILDTGNHSIRRMTLSTYEVITYAGSTNGSSGFVDGPRLDARFNVPLGMALDSNNNIYVGDNLNHRIRFIDTVIGVVYTPAGSGIGGSIDGTGQTASFWYPRGLTVSTDGYIYVGTMNGSSEGKIRRMSPFYPNIMSVNGSVNINTEPDFRYALNVKGNINTNGNISFIKDQSDNLNGAPMDGIGYYNTKLPGSPGFPLKFGGFFGTVFSSGNDGGQSFPYTMVIRQGKVGVGTQQPAWNLDVANSYNPTNAIGILGTGIGQQMTPGVKINNLHIGAYFTGGASVIWHNDANSGLIIQSSNGTVSMPRNNLVIGENLNTTGTTHLNGNVLIGTSGEASSGYNVTTFSGSDVAGFANGAGTAATYEDITSLSSDSQGRIYVYAKRDNTTRQIRRITNGVSETLFSITSGSGGYPSYPTIHSAANRIYYVKKEIPFPYKGIILSRRTTSDNGATYGAEVDIITGITHIGAMFQSYTNPDVLYYVNGYGIFKYYNSDGLIILIAGARLESGLVDSPTGTSARFEQIVSICLDSTDTYLYILDTGNYRIRRMTIATNEVITYAGGSSGFADGPRLNARFNLLLGMALDSNNNIYVVDNGNSKIRFIDTATGIVSTAAGSPVSGSTDGTGEVATFYVPIGITVSGGNIYVGTGDNKIRKVAPFYTPPNSTSVHPLRVAASATISEALVVKTDGSTTVYGGFHSLRTITCAGTVGICGNGASATFTVGASGGNTVTIIHGDTTVNGYIRGNSFRPVGGNWSILDPNGVDRIGFSNASGNGYSMYSAPTGHGHIWYTQGVQTMILESGGNLKITGNTMYIGPIVNTSTYNLIRFAGTFNDGNGLADHTVIGERIYVANTEKSELILFKGNDTDDRVRVLATGGFQVDISVSGGWGTGATDNPPAASVTALFIPSSGNVGIRTTDPGYALDVYGDVRATKFRGDGSALTGLPAASIAGINSGGFIGINGAASTTIRLSVNGAIYASENITAYSDRRVKENIVTIDSPLDKIMKMRGVYFTRNDIEQKQRQVGVIAQEVEEVLPEVVTTDTTEEKKKSVAYGNIVALLIEGIKEQNTKIEAQQSTINYLLTRV